MILESCGVRRPRGRSCVRTLRLRPSPFGSCRAKWAWSATKSTEPPQKNTQKEAGIWSSNWLNGRCCPAILLRERSKPREARSSLSTLLIPVVGVHRMSMSMTRTYTPLNIYILKWKTACLYPRGHAIHFRQCILFWYRISKTW